MHADDASTHHSVKDTTQSEELMVLDRRLKGNKLSFNVAKTRSMLIITKQK